MGAVNPFRSDTGTFDMQGMEQYYFSIPLFGIGFALRPPRPMR